MSYDEDLAYRIRELLAGVDAVSEKAMFGGLAFLISGNMAAAASRDGRLMVRVPPSETASYLSRKHARPMIMAGREARGWLRVGSEGIRTTRDLRRWIGVGVGYAGSLPAK